MEGIAKKHSPTKSVFIDSWVDLFCFLAALGQVFLIFSALETGLEINAFSGDEQDPKLMGWRW